MLSSGHEHSFICSLSFDVITVLKKQKSALPQRPALFICLYYVISIGVYMYTYVHIYTHTCVRVYLHTYVHIYI